MIDILNYPQTFSRNIIEGTFKRVFQKAGSYYQDIFLDTYDIAKDDFEEYLEKIIIPQNNSKIFKTVSTGYLKGNKHFDNYVIAYLYYKITNNYHLTQSVSNAIIQFHTQYKISHDKDEDIDISNLVRYFVHIVEIIQVYHTIEKKEISVKDAIGAIEAKEIVVEHSEDESSFKFIYEKQIYSVNSNIVVKNLNLTGLKTVFLNYYIQGIKKKRVKSNIEYEEINTSKNNKKYTEDKIFTTKAKKNQDPISKEDRIEENNSLKENIQVKIGNKNFKTKQKKRILAISASIAKNKLLLPSLYTIPSIGVLSKFLQHLLSDTDTKIRKYRTKKILTDEEKEFYTGIFIIAIVMGIKPKQVITLFFSRKKYTNDKNIVTLELDKKLYAEFIQFDEQTGVKTEMKVQYKIPFELIHYIEYLRKLSVIFDDKSYKEHLRVCNKGFEQELKISHSKIYNSAIVHKQLIQHTINSEILLATQNIDQNTTPRIAYTATSSRLSAYSSWLTEYLDVLDIKESLQKIVFGKVVNFKPTVIKTDTYPLAGTKKIVEKDAFISFLNQIENILKKERRLDRYTRFNLYSIYVRFSLSLLLGTRDFKKSVDFDRISWSLSILIIKEKGKYKNSGYREIPLTPLAKQIIKNYLEILKNLNISKQAVVLYDKNKVIPATLTNIKKVFKSFRFSQKYKQLSEQFDSIPLNFGRHVITTITTSMDVTIDDLNAFMGHGINGGEVLGIYSFHDIGAYRKKFTKIIEELEKSYNIKDIANAVRV